MIHPHRECASSPGMHILTGNAHSSYRVWWVEWNSCLNRHWSSSVFFRHYIKYGTGSPVILTHTRNQHKTCSFHCDSSSPGMHTLTGNWDVPHRECIPSQGIGMCLTGNAHSSYRVWWVEWNSCLNRHWSSSAFFRHYIKYGTGSPVILTHTREINIKHVHSIVIHPHRECKLSPGIGMCLTGNAYPHQE